MMKKLKSASLVQAELVKSTQTIYYGIPQVEIIAVSDLFAGPELEAWAAPQQFQTVTKDSHELIDNPDIDAIFICSSTDTHVPFIQLAARAGKHIFCEKPIAWISPKRSSH